jgi:hypothetical protein
VVVWELTMQRIQTPKFTSRVKLGKDISEESIVLNTAKMERGPPQASPS